MNKFVTGMFDSYDEAQQAAREVKQFGLRPENVNLITKDGARQAAGDNIYGQDTVLEEAAYDPTIVSTAGVAAGGSAMGMMGSYVNLGIPHDKGLDYENDFRKGKVLFSVEADERCCNNVAEMLRHSGAHKVDVHER